ncbi:MAG: hypothetical protein CM15mP101_11270 [Flavobacteriaceae bacterium]|nr:MAG: hypothetical protein CM15mP101_11270 [Flavobacteriaceae bacterium]
MILLKFLNPRTRLVLFLQTNSRRLHRIYQADLGCSYDQAQDNATEIGYKLKNYKNQIHGNYWMEFKLFDKSRKFKNYKVEK